MVRTKVTKKIQKKKKTIGKKQPKFPSIPKEEPTLNRCCICISDIQKKDEASLDCCGHKYCNECISEWAKTENSCPQCKRKFNTISHNKKETVVEDRRQTMAPPTTIDFSILQLPGIPVIDTMMRVCYQLSLFDEVDEITDTLLNSGITPQSLGIEYQYHACVRENTIIYFIKSRSWRLNLMNVLLRGMKREEDGEDITEGDIIAQMVFNVIDRFMLNVFANYPHLPSQMHELEAYITIARACVYGGSGIVDEPIDIDEVRLRPQHPSIHGVRERRSRHKHILWMWNHLRCICEDHTAYGFTILSANRHNDLTDESRYPIV